jgi:hypothetical protein
LTEVAVEEIPELVVIEPQLPEIVLILLPLAMPVMVKVSDGSTVPITWTD